MPDNRFPVAYFITFSTYGHWMHYDARGSVDRNHNQYLTPRIKHNEHLEKHLRSQLKYPPFLLNENYRNTVLFGIKSVCHHYHWRLYAAHVRTNHIHILLHACETSKIVPQRLKAFATNYLKKYRSESLPKQQYWARGESVKHLWDYPYLSIVHDYIIERQGEKMAYYSDPMFVNK